MGWIFLLFLILTFIIIIVTSFPSPQGNAHGPSNPTLSTPAPGVMMASGGGVGVVRRNWAGWREWRRADPTLINSLWRSKMGNGIRKQLGNAEVYIMLALLIGLVTVVIGCWLSDNCWSPEPETGGTVA
ncbi:uncharacterized protein [Onthophagus taurus]|uniref:uncharacterized protein n=1 Tax=Onthophagus taurus TaxID=166361 RepID=UPI0039BE8EA2